MKKALALSLLTLTVSMNAVAESAWHFDSCIENVIRQFTCSVNGQKISVDLEDRSTQIDFKPAGDDKIYGVFIKNISGGELYISCDDSGDLKNVKLELNGSSLPVSCEPDKE